jgi:4-hydroxy 2-oxovalerate aldolase
MRQEHDMTEQTQTTPAERWISYRPEIKVFDCTIRDGGLMNNHRFGDEVVRAVYDACVLAGIDYMELGYINSRTQFPGSEFGPWKHCGDADLRRVVGDNDTPLKLSAMADAEKCDYKTDILPRNESVLDMIRVATYIHQIPLAMDMIKDAHDKGYEATVNVMAVSTVQERELYEGIELLAGSEAEVIYVVDSFGSMYSEQIESLVERYLALCVAGGKEVGIHCHNNQQLGFANTIQAIIKGANFLDASFGGLGRGAGNCPMELLLSFLHNPKYRLRPVLKCIEDTIEPLRSGFAWGYDYPYMVTGILNEHPRAGMAFAAAKERGSMVAFYDEMASKE